MRVLGKALYRLRAIFHLSCEPALEIKSTRIITIELLHAYLQTYLQIQTFLLLYESKLMHSKSFCKFSGQTGK